MILICFVTHFFKQESANMEKCCITGIWYEQCVDLLCKGGGGSNMREKETSTTKKQKQQHASSSSSSASSYKKKSPSTTSESTNGLVKTTSLFIAPKFKHFSQMLWTVSKLDLVIKNYTLSWLLAQQQNTKKNNNESSKQEMIEKFGEDCIPFAQDLYEIFIHAVSHVCESLHKHMYSPLLG